jgi:hypothetical protein
MSISINYSSTIGLHGVDPVITSKNLIEWITSYNDITVTGKTNFNNDIQLSYDSLNFLNINIDENANTIFNITNVGNNNNLSTFIYNNKIQANNGISIKGDTIIGDSIDNSLFINSNIYINNNTIFNDVFFKDNIRIGGNLHITGTMNNPAISTNDITILGSNTNIGLTIDNTNTSNNSIINFKNNGNTIYSIGYSGSNQVFQICNSDFDSQPRITINSSGNVGIGTTNPNSKLHVKGNMKIKQEAQMNHTANDHDNALVFETPDSSHNYYIGYNYGGTFDIGYYDLTNYSRCLTMNPNFVATLGSVGIGTTNPSTKLHIYNSTVSNKIVENNVDLLIEDDNSRLQLISTDSGAGGSYIALSNALATPITTPSLTIHQKNWVFHHSGPSQNNKLGIYYRENGEDPNNNNISTESLYILSTTGLTLDTSGNVGIGTTSPSSKLHIEDSTSAVAFTINNTNSSNDSIINFNNLGSTQYSMGYDSSLNTFQICDGNFSNSSIFRINSNKITVGSSNTSYDINNFNISGSFYFARQGSNFDYSNNNFGGTGPNIRIGDYMYLGHTRANNFPYIAFNGYLSSSTYVSGGTTYNRWRHKYHNGTDTKITLITANTSGSISIKTANTTGNEIEENGYETTSNFTNIVHIGNTGNVGIGTSNPEDKLDVSGDIRLTGEMYFDYPRIFTLGSRDATGGGSGTKLVLQAKTNGKEFQMRNQDDLSCFAFAMYNHDELPSPSGSSIFDVYSAKDVVSRIGYAFIGYPGVTGNAGFGHINMFGNDQKYALRQTGLGATVLNSYNNDLYFRINNSEKMLIDTSGNVGIGTTTPSYNLDLYDGNLRLLYRNDSSVYNNFLTFERTSSDDCRINHYCNDQVSAQIDFNGYSQSAQSTIQFNTKESSGSLTNRMLINYNGNVGIGTTNPTEKLTVNGSNINATPCLGLRNGMSGGDAGTYGAQIALGWNGTNQYQHFISTRHYGGQEAGNRIDFYTCNGTQQNTITSGTNLVMSLDGTNVGIGVTNPTENLEVYSGQVSSSILGKAHIGNVGHTTAAAFCHVSYAHQQKYSLIQGSDGETYLNAPTNKNVRFRINNQDKMFLAGSTGNFGIGTTNPSTPLHIYSNTDGNTITIDNTNTGTTGRTSILFRPNGNNWELGARNSNSGDLTNKFYLYDINSSSSRLVVESSTGNVGIGTTNPTSSLHVVGPVDTNEAPLGVHIGTYNTSYSAIELISSSGLSSWIDFYNTGISGGTTDFSERIRGGAGQLEFYTNQASTQRMTINSSGNVGIGTTDPDEKLHVVGTIMCENPGHIILRDTTDTGKTPEIVFEEGVGHRNMEIVYDGSGGGTGNYFAIRSGYSAWDNVGLNYVPANGRVGIGTTSPNEKLDVYPNTDNSAIIGRAHIGHMGHNDYAGFSHLDINGSTGYALLQSTTGNTYLNAPSNNNVHFRINNQDKMFLSGAAATLGNLGIGTTDPQSKLHISSGTSGDCELILEADTDNNNENDNPRILFRQDSGNDWSMIGNNNNSLVLANSVGSGGGILFKTGATGVDRAYENATERMRIDSSGNVGIGATDPDEKLEVYPNQDESAIIGKAHIGWVGWDNHAGFSHLNINGANSYALLQSTTGNTYLNAPSNNNVHFRINNQDKMFLSGAAATLGNFGIGTTNPTEKLEVNGNIKGTNFIGNVDGTLDNYDSTRFFRREGRTNASVSSGWISVATCTNAGSTAGRYAGEILVTDREGGDHSYIRIHWMRSFNDSNFTVINCGGHSNRITGARVLYQTSNNTYGEKILQVKVTATSNYYVSVFRMGDDPNYGTFTALTPVLENTKTGFAVHGNELTNLDAYGFAHEEGILAGGNMKAGGDLHVVGNVGIGTTNPLTALHVVGDITLKNPNYSSSYSGWRLNPGYGGSPEPGGTSNPHAENLYFYVNGQLVGYVEDDNTTNYRMNDFTGQHRSILNQSIDENSVGLIVSSNGTYINLDNTLYASINESLPTCNITTIDNDIKVFGVISNKEDTKDTRRYESGAFITPVEKTNKNEQRMYINSVGEGAVWVCNKNGALTNGDYISSSSVSGYGMKQILNQNILANHTVAKITCDCDFILTKIVKQKLKVITTTETYEENVTQDVQKTNTETKIEYDTTLSRYVQKEITNTTTDKQQIYDTVDLYNEDGEVIGTHQIERKITKTRTIQNIDYDENGDVQYEDDLDENGNQQMIYPFETRFLLPDGTQITEEEYNTKKSLGEIVYIACFVGCTYHCG